MRDSGAAFGVEVPSLQEWTRGPDDLCRLAGPTLSVVNEGSAWPGFRETHDRLLEWLPRAEGVSVGARSHLLQIEQPTLVADAVASFLDHPIR